MNHLPSPDELAAAPELGVLVLLDEALAMTVHALLARYPGAADGSEPDTPQARLHEAIVSQIAALRGLIGRYRLAIVFGNVR